MPQFVDPMGQAREETNSYVEFHNDDGKPYRSDDINGQEKGVSTGTTILAVEFDGGVVMAADSRTSMGDYIANRVSRKITPVHDRIFVCRSGSAADTQALTAMVAHYLSIHSMELKEPQYPKVNVCASLFRTIAYENKDHLMAGLIVAGWDKHEGGQVYNIPLGGAKFRRGYAVGGSGSAYIMGLIDAEYRPGMSQEEARKLCKKWVSHAMARDGSSGGVIRTMVIKESGIDEDFTYGDNLPCKAL